MSISTISIKSISVHAGPGEHTVQVPCHIEMMASLADHFVNKLNKLWQI
jgi:hypothetical protein